MRKRLHQESEPGDDSSTAGDNIVRNNRERAEGLLDFDPDRNEIDAELYENIVDAEFIPGRRQANLYQSSRLSVNSEYERSEADDFNSINIDDEDVQSDDERSDNENEPDAKGVLPVFNTNIDDFLEGFGSFKFNRGASDARDRRIESVADSRNALKNSSHSILSPVHGSA